MMSNLPTRVFSLTHKLQPLLYHSLVNWISMYFLEVYNIFV